MPDYYGDALLSFILIILIIILSAGIFCFFKKKVEKNIGKNKNISLEEMMVIDKNHKIVSIYNKTTQTSHLILLSSNGNSCTVDKFSCLQDK